MSYHGQPLLAVSSGFHWVSPGWILQSQRSSSMSNKWSGQVEAGRSRGKFSRKASVKSYHSEHTEHAATEQIFWWCFLIYSIDSRHWENNNNNNHKQQPQTTLRQTLQQTLWISVLNSVHERAWMIESELVLLQRLFTIQKWCEQQRANMKVWRFRCTTRVTLKPNRAFA